MSQKSELETLHTEPAERWRERAHREEKYSHTLERLLSATVIVIGILMVVLALTMPAGGAETDPMPEPAPAAQALPEPQEEAENERIEAALLERAAVIEDCVVTHYDVCMACCGKTDGITASGVRAVPGVTVAVDPAVIPLGSDVLVDYGDGHIHYYRADDTGFGVTGNHIDLCVDTHEEAVALGVRTATVWWVEP